MTTTGIVLIEEHAQRVKPPRMLAVPFNFGKALGKPGDPEFQQTVLNATFDLLNRDSSPVLEQFESETNPDQAIVQGTQVTNSIKLSKGLVLEEADSLKPYYTQWVEGNAGRTAFGLSGLEPVRFNEVIGFLEGYTGGNAVDTTMKPPETSLANFIRYCVDDIKSYYYESMMARDTYDSDHKIHEWFWSETAAGALVIRLAEKMKEDEDDEIKGMSFGIAR